MTFQACLISRSGNSTSSSFHSWYFCLQKSLFCVVPLKCWCSSCLSFLLRCEPLEVWSEEPGKIIKALPLCLLHLFVAFYIYLSMVSYDVQHPAAAMNLKQPAFYSFTVLFYRSVYLFFITISFYHRQIHCISELRFPHLNHFPLRSMILIFQNVIRVYWVCGLD